MSQDVSNRMLMMRDYFVGVFRAVEKNFGLPATVLAQQVYLVLSAEEAKPFVEDIDAAQFSSDLRGDRPVVPETGGPAVTGDGPIGS